MNTELLPCPFCGGKVSFHQDDSPEQECEGCHGIWCPNCGIFDFSPAADPDNDAEDLITMRELCAPFWNRRVVSH